MLFFACLFVKERRLSCVLASTATSGSGRRSGRVNDSDSGLGDGGGGLGSTSDAGTSNDLVDFADDGLDGLLDVGGFEGRGLDEGETLLLGKGLGLLGGDSTKMTKIALVSDEHDDDVGISVVAELRQPSLDVLERVLLGDVIHKQSSNSSSVVSAGDGSVSLLASSVPDLRLNHLAVDRDTTGGKLDTDGGLGFEVELIAGESREEVALSDTRVSDQHNLEEVVVFVVLAHCGWVMDVLRGRCAMDL